MESNPIPPPLAVALSASFGSVESWQADLESLVERHRRSPGRVIFGFAPSSGRLVNQWVDADRSYASTLADLATLEISEGVEAAAVRASKDVAFDFIRAIDWSTVHRTYQHVVHDASSTFASTASTVGAAMMIDVRRREVYKAEGDRIRGATWHDPASIGSWLADLPRSSEVVVYCVAGHEMSQGAALRLRAEGIDARYLAGGIEAWKRDGGPFCAQIDSRSCTT